VQLSPRYDVEPTKHSPRNDRLPAVKADFKFVDRSNRTIDMSLLVTSLPGRVCRHQAQRDRAALGQKQSCRLRVAGLASSVRSG
jgi:hypothetical protein